MDAITAEALARNNSRWSQNTAISNTDAITAETLARTTADENQKTQLFPIIQTITAEATTRVMQ
jgi:hypothetical protein